MKLLFVPLLITLLSVSLPAEARGNNSPWYLSFKGGFMDAGAVGADDALNTGLGIGYQHGGYVSTELEYTSTLIEGETAKGKDWDVTTLSAFAAMRSTTPIKLKGKMGISHVNNGGDDDWDLSVGLGLGFWTSTGLLEVEYTKINDDLSFFSVGLNIFY